MDAAKPSRTALSVALRRALHQLYDPPPRVLEDPVAIALLGALYKPALERARDSLNEPFSLGMRAFLLARSRFAEETLAQAVSQGCDQYVLLGAGLDTFAHRNPHPNVRVFEVDHPATQAWKRNLRTACSLPTPIHLHYAPVDFETQSLALQLAAAGLDSARPTVFAWLGVVMYLTLDAFRGTIDYIAGFPPGSAVIFDYSQPRHVLPPDEQRRQDLLVARVAEAGEPFRLFMTPSQAALELARFRRIEDLGAADLNPRYFAGRSDRLQLAGTAGRLLRAWK